MRNAPLRRVRLGGWLLAVMIAGSLLLADVAQAVTKPRLVQRRFLRIKTGSSISVKLLRAVTAGNLIIAHVVWDNGGSVSLTDSNGNPYISAIGPTQPSGDGTNSQIFYAQNVNGGTDTITTNFAAAITARGILYVYEYSAVDRVSPLVAAVAASGSSASMDSGFVDTGSANALLFTGGASNKAVTKIVQGYRTLSRIYGTYAADKIPATAGLYNVSGMQSGTAWVAQLVALRSIPDDLTKPTVPTNVQASNITSNAATISWTPSTDDTGVAGYRVFRNLIQIATTTQSSFTDLKLSPVKTYKYTVAAYDGAGRVSAKSSPALSVTTTAVKPPIPMPRIR